jgi:6-phosphogluconolactonase
MKKNHGLAFGLTLGIVLLAACSSGGDATIYRYYALVTYESSTSASVFSLDIESGTLTPVAGSPFFVEISYDGHAGIVVEPSGRFAYSAGSGGILAYAINAETGALSYVDNRPFPAGGAPQSIAIDPGGKFIYIAAYYFNDLVDVLAYGIDAATGTMTYVPGGSIAAGEEPRSITVDPSGRFVYVTDRFSNCVYAFTIDAVKGTLTPVAGSPYPTGSAPVAVAVDPSGKFAYVADQFSYVISAFAIDRDTGGLAPVAGAPFAAGHGPCSIAFNPSGGFAYVANYSSNTVSAYTVNIATGALIGVAGSPFAAESGPRAIAADPTGEFVYVANYGSKSISAYAVRHATGALDEIPGSPFATDNATPAGLAIIRIPR